MGSIDLITLTNPTSPVAEAYRSLRTNLLFSSVEKPVRAFVMTSTANADDKSKAIANLAVTFAQAGHKTVLVDADLRQPAQHTIWNLSNEQGLSSMMVNDAQLANPPLIKTEIDNLSVLTSGTVPANPADLLSSQRMDEIIGLLKARVNYILIDCPPVLAATDAALLGAKTDGVVLVVKASKTRRDHVTRAHQALERVHVRVIGTVLTNSREKQASY